MKKLLLMTALASLSPLAGAQQYSSLSQLTAAAPQVSIPQASPPDTSGGIFSYVHNIYNAWDPAAPYSYNQNPAQPFVDGGIKIKNVRWGLTPADHRSYSWETVSINPGLIEKVVYGYKTLGTGHTLLTFIFKEGGVTSSLGTTARALTFGAEGWSREPYGYTLSHALKGRYPLIWNVTTFESYADYVVGSSKMNIFFRNMNLDRAQTLRLFELLLARIEETNRNQETYNLLYDSCTNNPVDLINRVLPKTQRISLETAGLVNPNAAIPLLAAKKYTRKGVLQAEIFRIGPDNYGSFDLLKI